MTYRQTCDYLFSQIPSFEKNGAVGFHEGLKTTLALDEHFGHPHHCFKTIHVAGTNGKGSVSHSLAAQLQAEGYKVGLYTSPHLVDFRERIRVNGQMIPEDYVVSFVDENRPFFESLSPSFFELTTAMAFKFFKEQGVDIAVIEVGLGGRLDCTNIITPTLSVITNIDFDHTQFLGNTLELIASEKAGIIKQNVPVVIGEANEHTRPVFEQKAKAMSAPITFAEDAPKVISFAEDGDAITYTEDNGHQFKGELSGLYQVKNTNTILHALYALIGMGVMKSIHYDAFMQICSTTGLTGRWQVLERNPMVVCDTGHNPAGWRYLSRQLSEVKCRHMHIIFGMVDDKDFTRVVQMLPPQATYYYTKAHTSRAVTKEAMLNAASQLGKEGHWYDTVTEAFKAAKASSEADDFIFIGGSNYLVAEFLEARI